MHELEGSVERPRLVLVSGRGLWCCALPSFLGTLDRSRPDWCRVPMAPIGCGHTPMVAYAHWRRVTKKLEQDELALLRERMRLMLNAAPKYQHPNERAEQHVRLVEHTPDSEWDADGRIARDLRDMRRMAIGCAVLVVALVLGLTLCQ